MLMTGNTSSRIFRTEHRLRTSRPELGLFSTVFWEFCPMAFQFAPRNRCKARRHILKSLVVSFSHEARPAAPRTSASIVLPAVCESRQPMFNELLGDSVHMRLRTGRGKR